MMRNIGETGVGEATREFPIQSQEISPGAPRKISAINSVFPELIVQGSYDRQGFSIPTAHPGPGKPVHGKGDSLPSLGWIEFQLNAGSLSHRSDLEKRLFIYNWSLNDSPALIQRIRGKAIWIADHDRAFWSLRNEVHEAQTWENVRKIEAFLSRYQGPPAVRREIAGLIADLKELLGEESAPTRIADWTRTVRANDAVRHSLTSLMEGYSSLSPVGRLDRIRQLRSAWRAATRLGDPPLALKERFFPDRRLSQQAVVDGNEVVEQLERGKIPTDPPTVLAVGKDMIGQVELDDLLTEAQANRLIGALEAVTATPGISNAEKLGALSSLLKNALDQVYTRLRREFGAYDDQLHGAVTRPEGGVPVKFVDETLRSLNTLPLGRLVDQVERASLTARNLRHEIRGRSSSDPIEAFNPGDKVGTLRFNPDPDTLTPEDIAVFDRLPAETAPPGGIITLGAGARLSHLQLLAKSLHIPNSRFSAQYIDDLKALEGQRVRYSVEPSGKVRLEAAGKEPAPTSLAKLAPAAPPVPPPDFGLASPLSLDALARESTRNVAGPKGMNLARLRARAELRDSVPDGFVLPFGYFELYARRTGLQPLLKQLGGTSLRDRHQVAGLSARVRRHIRENPVPEDLLDLVMDELDRLGRRTGHEGGYFFRSDTNLEDLPDFNGAGLNETVPNTKARRAEVQRAIQAVWSSPFREGPIYWRALALRSTTVPLAEPSIVVMPTVTAESSGVILSRGGGDWRPGRGSISANWGIGSVVQAGDPVEEISLASGSPLRMSFTVSDRKPVPGAEGGLTAVPVEPGQPVLSDAQITALNREAIRVETALGPRTHGWDIEWAIDERGRIRILQARPNP